MAAYHLAFHTGNRASTCSRPACHGAATVATGDGDMVCPQCGIVAAARMQASDYRVVGDAVAVSLHPAPVGGGGVGRPLGGTRGARTASRGGGGGGAHPSVAAGRARHAVRVLGGAMRRASATTDEAGVRLAALSRPVADYATRLHLGAALEAAARAFLARWAEEDVAKFRHHEIAAAAALVLATRVASAGRNALSLRLAARVLDLDLVPLGRYVKKITERLGVKQGTGACDIALAPRWAAWLGGFFADDPDALPCLRALLAAAAAAADELACPRPIVPDAKAAALLWLAHAVVRGPDDGASRALQGRLAGTVASWAAIADGRRRILACAVFMDAVRAAEGVPPAWVARVEDLAREYAGGTTTLPQTTAKKA